ncbi:hypothetical protein [Paenibacillus selenitireducens]|nr:hypothetical protein [Paenibacillus selenitireducens]
MLRPDLKTAGGEVHDIVLNHRYVGTLSLVYREGERVSGSVQLEQDSLSLEDKPDVIAFVTQYIQGLTGALSASKCDVFVSYSSFDTIVSTSEEIEEQVDVHEWFPEDVEEEDTWDGLSDDEDEEDDDELVNLNEIEPDDSLRLDLISAGRYVSVYDVYDVEEELVAVSIMKQYGADVTGEVRWDRLPAEEELDRLTALLVGDLDNLLMDTITIEMKLGDLTLETIELTHEDVLSEPKDVELFVDPSLTGSTQGTYQGGYYMEAVRDDVDVLSYAVYHERTGAVPVGVATVDISNSELTGFIDLEIPGSTQDRAEMATLLMRELDKVLDYDSLNLTMMFRNEMIDEIQFENELQ